MTALPPDVADDLRQENARLHAELRAARERQNASAEILRAIAGTSGDAEKSLLQIAETTERLFGASSVTLLVADGERFGLTVRVGAGSERIAAAIPQAHIAITPQFMPGAVYLENRQVHVGDIDDPTAKARWPGLTPARTVGTRTMSGTPLRYEGRAIGSLIVHRDRLEPFTADELALQQSFADQAAIAIENARLFNESQEALERQTTTAEILKVIAGSPSDVQPVFDAIAESAKRLSKGHSATVTRVIGDMIHLAAFTSGTEAGRKELQSSFPTPLSSAGIHSRVARAGELAFRTDMETEPDLTPAMKELARARGYRSILVVPMLRDGVAIGTIGVTRRDPGPFDDNVVDLMRTFADQAVIAIENARLFNETQAALARQTATSDVLRVISGSPTDEQPVFDAIVLTAARLLRCDRAFIQRCDGAFFWTVASAGQEGPRPITQSTKAPVDPDANFPSRAIQAKKTLHLPDWSTIELPEFERSIRERHGTNSALYMPLLREGECIGLLAIIGKQAGMFGESEIALAESFRDQALIAIENTRLFNETKEALERQTVTADILKVIASSPSDTTPVFQAIATSASRLLGGFSAAVFRFLDGTVHLAAFTPVSPVADAALKADFPKPVDEFEGFRLAQQGKPFPIPDTEEILDPPELREIARLHGFRSMLFVPLMNGGVLIGIISVTRLKPGTFSPNHIQLLQTFADQAVIAVENARLFNETKEALERQTATADILKVIASSPSDVQPVFDVIVERAVSLCGARMGRVYRYDDGIIHMVAGHGLSTPGLSKVQEVFPRPAGDDTTSGLAIRSRRANFVTDIRTDQWVPPLSRQMIEALGTRSQVTVPMLRKGEPIGAITVGWAEPAAWGDQQVALLQTFADQAVIAIENVRLFNETREALERQTATADILKVIASSPSDVQPVFEAIAESANRLIGGFSATVILFVGDVLQLVAFTPTTPTADEMLQASFPRPLAEFPPFELVRDGESVQFPDTESEGVPPVNRSLARSRGYRGMLFTPLMNKGAAIGILSVTRKQPGAFATHHVQLLQTFADQAVIAIENARLFNETREALERQTATADILKVIASSPSDVQPVFEAIAASANRLVGGFSCTVVRFIDGTAYLKAFTPTTREADEILQSSFPQPVAGFLPFQSALAGEVTQVPDTEAMTGGIQDIARARGFRSMLFAPLVNKGEPIGTIGVTRVQPGTFSNHHVQLLQTFADQAVIAIENVRLFDEVKAKTRDLTEALTYQTGSGNILRVIASSPTDVQPVLKAIVESACELCEADDAVVQLREGDDLVFAAHRGSIPVGLQRRAISRNFVSGRANVDKVPVHLRDALSAEGDEFPEAQEMSRRLGTRTLLAAPLLREGEGIGTILLRRTEVKPFSDKQIALLQTFADQAVIAIGNVHLFDEVQAKTRDLTEALTYQTGSSNILRVIASSPTDVGPVLRAIAESACELCNAVDALVLLKDGDSLRHGAHHGPIPYALEKWPINRNWASARAFLDRQPVHVLDMLSAEGDEFPDTRERARRTGTRTYLCVPLLREGESIGTIVLRRTEVRPFSDKQIALLQTFADQAVIAIGNVRLFDEVQARTRDLTESLQQQTATADVLKVISRSAFDLQPVLDVIVETSRELCGCDASTIFLLRDRKFHVTAVSGALPTHLEFLRSNPASVDQPGSVLARVYREKRTLHYPNVADDPELSQGMTGLGGPRALLTVPLMRDDEVIGGITLRQSHLKPFTARQIEAIETFADQAVIAISNVGLFEQVQQRTKELSQSLDELRTAQDRLVQTEKLASLGQLTAGIAHEIKNPLNFVNNFSSLSAELTDELNDVLKSAVLTDNIRLEVDELTGLLKDNLLKVVQHGKRADSIVKNMLLHSREGSGEHRPADINAILDESLNLAYHGARAEKREFNVTLQRDFDELAGTIEVFPQEITRVFLNLISNGFYAVTKRKTENGGSGFEPVVRATTKNLGDTVEIRIRDNGTGIPDEVKEKMFNPFFTTKPAGEGTGLGLSMSHDIIVKQHGGTIDVETAPGEFTEFTIVLPRTGNISNKSRGQT